MNINNYDFLKVKLIYKVKKLINSVIYKSKNSYQENLNMSNMSNELENMPITQTCAICLEELTVPSPNICITECAHVFHLNCFLQNREFNITCPMCRSDIPKGVQPFQEEVQDLNVLPDGMLEENVSVQQNLLFDIFGILEDISIGRQLATEIRFIVNSAANNNISNFDIEPHEVIDIIHEQIYQLCISFANSAFNYLRNIANHRYDINHLNYNNVNFQFHINQFDLHDRITALVTSAANNNIRDNRTFDKMEHDIHNLCIHFSDSVIGNRQNRDNRREV